MKVNIQKASSWKGSETRMCIQSNSSYADSMYGHGGEPGKSADDNNNLHRNGLKE